MAYALYVKDTNTRIGTITEEQVQTLIDLFEEEDTSDQDYFINADTLEFMKDKSADEQLIALIEPHIGDDGAEFEWREED